MSSGATRASLIAMSLWAAMASLSAAADVVWPEEWTAFGPSLIRQVGAYGTPQASDLLPGSALKTIPPELEIGTNRFPGKPLRLNTRVFDLADLIPPSERGSRGRGLTVYLLAPVTASADTVIQVGAGANWWMQWWLDGQPVYDTLGVYGNGPSAITGRDHVFDIALTRGEHVLAVAVIRASKGFGVAVTSPRELSAHPVSFEDAMAAGLKQYKPSHWSVPIHHAAARNDFRQALRQAGTDAERAEAHLALADDFLLDVWGVSPTNAPGIRRDYEAVLALPGARADQKARAVLGVAETRRLEHDCAGAREDLARALPLSEQPDWAPAVHLAMARSFMQEGRDDDARRLLEPLAGLSVPNRADPLAKLAFNARLHLAALTVAPRVRPDRPRLFFNADTWPAVKARLEADAKPFEKLRRDVHSLPDEFQARDWGREYVFKDGDTWKSHTHLMPAALVYRATGDPAVLDSIRKMLRATMDHYLQLDAYNAHMESRVCFLAALDWVWNDLPAAERDGLARDMLRYAYGWHRQFMLGGKANHDPFYYLSNIFWYAGLALLEPGVHPVDRMRALTLLGRGYDNNVEASFRGRLDVMRDRGRVTGVGYAFLDLPTPSWTFLQCWRSAIGPVPAEWAFASGIAPSCVLRNMLGYEPRNFRHFGHGKSWRAKGGWLSGRLLYHNLGQFISFFAETEPVETAIAAWIRERMEAAGCVGPGHYVIDPYITELDRAPPAALPAGLPLARYYPVNGLVLMSSGFDVDESTYAQFVCGGGRPLGGHFDAGHFTIFKKGYLALDSGSRALGQDTEPKTAASGVNYDTQTVAHNTLLIRMPGETMPRVWNLPVEANTGGQCRPPTAATVLAFETSPLFAYVATDVTDTYHSNKCARLTRQFLYLPPDHFVVFDRVVSTQPDYPKTWLLHTANEPVIRGREFQADQEQGRLFCRTLLPADAVLEPVGGPGKEFWADGRNWPIPAGSSYLRGMGMTSADDVPENVGRWRVEVKPGAARADDCFLHLIQVGARETLAAMTPSARIEDGQTAGIEFQAGTRTVRALFRKAGPVGGHILVAEDGAVQADRPLTEAIQRQEGLALDPTR